MNLKTFKHDDWEQIWAGSWSVQTCSHLGNHLTKGIMFDGKSFLSQSIIVVREHKSACWARQTDRERAGTYLAGQAARREKFVADICVDLKRAADEILAFIKKCDGKLLTLSRYRDYWNWVCWYYQRHATNKYITDYLPMSLLEKFLPKLEEARLYAEPVFKHIEDFVEAYAQWIAEKEKISKESALAMVAEETECYLSDEIMPPQKILHERFKHAALVFDRKTHAVYSGTKAEEVEKEIIAVSTSGKVKGEIAYRGIAKGMVRIVWEPRNARIFNDGDILITGMTRPEFLPLMKKAGAFITDAGGILSHAAIIAREMRKPCIIGTKIATKVLKDGDLVEVDANTGVVRILKRA